MRTVKRKPIIDYNEYDIIDEKIWKIRGIKLDDVPNFLEPPKDFIRNPFELLNMDIVVKRILKALQNNEKIVVYADTDCDGVTSCAIIYNYFRVYTNHIYYVSNQRKEGHGVIVNKVDKDTDLLIIVDSSTNSSNECKEISQFCDVIILDHHDKSVDNPYATIVNPQICNYENKFLSGATVCYQLCRAFDMINGYEFADNFLDLACVGMVGDMMKLDNLENRAIAFHGLKNIHDMCQGEFFDGNIGLSRLFKGLKKDFMPTTQDISFYIAPCINAIVRLGDIYDLLELFTTSNTKICNQLVKMIIEKNEDRKKLTTEITKDIIDKNLINDDKIIIIDETEFEYDSAMFGLIANKIGQQYQRPCFFGKVVNGEFKGSGRSFGEEVKLKTELRNSKLFTLAEGHESSFGVGFKYENIDKIKNYFNDKFKNYFNEVFINYDLELSYDELSEYNLNLIDKISKICGEGFEPPRFLIKGLEIDKSDKIGKEKNHTKLTISDDIDLNIMKFNTDENTFEYDYSDYINVVGIIGMNYFYHFGKKEMITTKQILSDYIECIYL